MSHEEIRAALAAATDGPWARWADMDGAAEMRGLLMVGIADEVIPAGEVLVDTREPDGSSPVAECYTAEDAHLIANAPTWLADLLAEVSLRQTLLQLRGETIDALAARAEAAEDKLAKVREIAEHYSGRTYTTGCSDSILRVMDGGES